MSIDVSRPIDTSARNRADQSLSGGRGASPVHAVGARVEAQRSGLRALLHGEGRLDVVDLRAERIWRVF